MRPVGSACVLNKIGGRKPPRSRCRTQNLRDFWTQRSGDAAVILATATNASIVLFNSCRLLFRHPGTHTGAPRCAFSVTEKRIGSFGTSLEKTDHPVPAPLWWDSFDLRQDAWFGTLNRAMFTRAHGFRSCAGLIWIRLGFSFVCPPKFNWVWVVPTGPLDTPQNTPRVHLLLAATGSQSAL